MKNNTILTNRLRNIYIIYNKKEISYYDYYVLRPDLLKKDVESNIFQTEKVWKVTDFGCNFNYIKYIKHMSSSYPQIIGYNDGLVVEVK